MRCCCYVVLLLVGLIASLVGGSSRHISARQRAMRSIRNFQDGEELCRRKSALTKDQVLVSVCKKPTDPDLQQRVGKYSLCSLMNTYQMMRNGTFIFTPFADCSAEGLADNSTTSHLSQDDRVRLCQMQTATYECQRSIERFL